MCKVNGFLMTINVSVLYNLSKVEGSGSMNVSFRLLQLEDIEEVIKLCNKVFEENTNVDDAKRIFNETKDDYNQIYIVGLVNEKIVGHMKITIIPTMYEDMGTYAILNHVCVDEEYRRHNIATKMLEYAEKICKEHGCINMELWSKNFRIPAHECYKKYGFKVIDAGFFSKEIN